MARSSIVAILVCVACAACNALSGGDKLSVEPGSDDIPLTKTCVGVPEPPSTSTTMHHRGPRKRSTS